MVDAKIAAMRQGKRADLSSIEGRLSQAGAAELINVRTTSVECAKKVLEEGASDLIATVEQEKVAVSATAAIAALPKEEQEEGVARGQLSKTAAHSWRLAAP